MKNLSNLCMVALCVLLFSNCAQDLPEPAYPVSESPEPASVPADLNGSKYLVTCHYSGLVYVESTYGYETVTEELFTDTLTVHPGVDEEYTLTLRDEVFNVTLEADSTFSDYRMNGTLTRKNFNLNIGLGGGMGGNVYYTGVRIF